MRQPLFGTKRFNMEQQQLVVFKAVHLTNPNVSLTQQFQFLMFLLFNFRFIAEENFSGFFVDFSKIDENVQVLLVCACSSMFFAFSCWQ